VTKKWTREETDILIDSYSDYTYKYISENLLFGRTENSITRKAKELGLCKIKRWSEDEIRMLKESYLNHTSDYISSNLLHGRCVSSIEKKANFLGLYKSLIWTDEEVKLLIGSYSNYSYKYISENILLGRTEDSIKKKSSQLKLRVHSESDWTEDEIVILIDSYSNHTYKYLSANLLPGRTEKSIREKVNSLMLKRDPPDYYHLYLRMIKSSSKRNIYMDFTFDEFVRFVDIQECTYCRETIYWARRPINGNSYNIDRKDSSNGYTKDNCCVCCYKCNNIKGNNKSFHEMIDLMEAERSSMQSA
jgi:hypothetical protein